MTTILLAAQAAQQGGSMAGMLIMMVAIFAIMYFLMIRPQMKRQKEHRNLVANLSKGDEVITGGGIAGTVTKLNDNFIAITVADIADKPVEIVVQRQAVSSVLPKGTIKSL